MSSAKGNYWENQILNTFTGTAAAHPATLYIAFYTVAPTGANASGTEATGGNYSRTAVTCNGTNFGVSGNQPATLTNLLDITCFTASADVSSGSNMVAWALYDAATVGNCLYWGTFTNQPIKSGQTPIVTAGSLSITET